LALAVDYAHVIRACIVLYCDELQSISITATLTSLQAATGSHRLS